MAYNTGNAIGSADVRDLYDNAQNLDKAMNSTDPTWIDRFGVARPTFKGAESELNQKVGDAEAAATQALGYLNTMRATSYGPLAEDPTTDPLGNPCTAGDEYFNTTYNLLKRFDGSIWRVPDINTENLASGAGSSMVGHGGQTVEAALNERLPEIGNYAGLDAYTGDATAVLIYGVSNIFDGGAGVFRRTTDTPVSANGIYRQDALGRWWKRDYTGPIQAAWFSVKGNGTDDDTVNLQAWLDQPGDLIAQPGKTYKTTATLYNQRPNRRVDFQGSKVKNLANSRYAIVTVSESLANRTDAGLLAFMNEAHFSDQIGFSDVCNLVYEMSPAVSSGANLGAGIVYGRHCALENVECLSSNGNGLEIRGSYACRIDAKLVGFRNYGVFNYMSKLTDIRMHSTGGDRGLVIKHAYYDDPDVNVYIHDSVIKNAADRSIGGGASAGTGGSPDLEPTGHEIVRGVVVERGLLASDSGVAVAPKIWIGNHADHWTVRDVLMRNGSTATSTQFITVGGEGTAGYAVGTDHYFDNVDISGSAGEATAQISCTIPSKFRKVKISGTMFWGIYFGAPVNASDLTPCAVEDCELVGAFITVGSTTGAPIEAVSGVNQISVARNTIRGDFVANVGTPSRNAVKAIVAAAKRSKVIGNTVDLTVPSASLAGSVTCVTANATEGALVQQNDVKITNEINSISIFGILGANVASLINSNDLGIAQNAGTPGTSQGIRYVTGGKVGDNLFSGAWTTGVQAI